MLDIRIKKGRRFLVLIFPKLGFAIKTTNIKSNLNEIQAKEHLFHEYIILKKIKKYNLSPIPLYLSKNRNNLFMEIIKGITLKNFLFNTNLNNKKLVNNEKLEYVINQLLIYCIILDELGIIKKEMHRPENHVYIEEINNKEINHQILNKIEHITKNKIKDELTNKLNIKIIDFERSRILNKKTTKNFSQFMQFLARINYINRKYILEIVQDYKKL